MRADLVFDSREAGWVEQVLSATSGRGGHINEPVGGDRIDLSLKAMAFSGNLHGMCERGLLPVQIGATFPLDRAVDAVQEIHPRRVQGKVVLTA